MELGLTNVNIDEIVIKSRIREELGDINELANSIKEIGLLSPILINKNNILVSGLRRIKACRKLGYTKIQALIIDINDEMALFNMEAQENLRRKDLTHSELDKEIEIKKRFAYDKFRKKSFLKNIWNRLSKIFRKIKRKK